MEKSLEIQRLRAFAILMVLLGHTFFNLPGYLIKGFTGVTLFFVVSGYVVTSSFIRSFPDTPAIFDRSIAYHIISGISLCAGSSGFYLLQFHGFFYVFL